MYTSEYQSNPINWNLKNPDGDTLRIFKGTIWIWIRLLVSLKRIIFPTFTIEVVDGDVEDINFLIETYQSVT